MRDVSAKTTPKDSAAEVISAQSMVQRETVHPEVSFGNEKDCENKTDNEIRAPTYKVWKFSFHFQVPWPHLMTKDPEAVVEGSIYALFLSDNIVAMAISFILFAIQCFVAFVFGFVDWNEEYLRMFSRRSCNEGCLTTTELILALLLLYFHVAGELFKGAQLLVRGVLDRRPKVIILGMGVFCLTMAIFVIGFNYVLKQSSGIMDAFANVFVLIWVLDVDEKVWEMMDYYDPLFISRSLTIAATDDNDNGNKNDMPFNEEEKSSRK